MVLSWFCCWARTLIKFQASFSVFRLLMIQNVCLCFCVLRSRRHTLPCLHPPFYLFIVWAMCCSRVHSFSLVHQWLLQRSAARSAQRFEPKSYSKEAKTRRIKGAIPATVDTNAQTITFRSLLSGKLVWCARHAKNMLLSPPAMLTFAFVKADYGF